MDAATLRSIQAPLKDQYKQDPSAALVTLSSSGSLDSTSITCKLSTGAATKKVAGLHPLSGGPNPDLSGELCSGDLLLEALVACAGVTLKAVATALEIPVRAGEVKAEGDLDFRGTLGVDKSAPVGFKEIRLGFELEVGEDVGQEKLDLLLRLTERYCVVLQTICSKPKLTAMITKKDGEGA